MTHDEQHTDFQGAGAAKKLWATPIVETAELKLAEFQAGPPSPDFFSPS